MPLDSEPSTSHPLSEGSQACLMLPDAPADLTGPVKAWEQAVEILTYEPAKPDLNPMFLEKRVYQGSSGRVYPLPFIDRIASEPTRKLWRAIHIENEFLRIMVLPEIGGRIHIGYDKTTGYDFFYRQNVIKPALVGLAGPWVSGGVEFNWPQHHRPATYMPVETAIDQDGDGSVTVWCSDHDPMLRMKGMHGICLHPGRAVLELKVRLYNRTPFTQTFLWWANVATRVHERYQSFFPTDVRYVADHAKRAVTAFPESDGVYYGVDYGARARTGVPAEEMPSHFVPDGSYPPNDLSWYSNIPVPTSYMVTGTEQDFFGGYDHAAGAGVVHVANHHIAPGKKQWTWGNHEFGYAWDRSLTDTDGPYIELMAGVYTDNQPDFSFLAPWETKTFVQNWFPIHAIGVPQAANTDAALSLQKEGSKVRLGVYVTRDVSDVDVSLRAGGNEVFRFRGDLRVQEPLQAAADLAADAAEAPLRVVVEHAAGVLIEYDEADVPEAAAPHVAVEPSSPADVPTNEELYLIGLHLHQYRHATRLPELYWKEALRRDESDARCNNAMGIWHLQRGEFEVAAHHFKRAIARLTALNPNPYDGETHYNLGLTERLLGHPKEAYKAFYKATWNAAWKTAAFLALSEMDAAQNDWTKACEHARQALRADTDNLHARNVLTLALTKLDRANEAVQEHKEILQLDPLDLTARHRDGHMPVDGQQMLDLAFDLLRCGQRETAAELLRRASGSSVDGSTPIVLYLLAQVEAELNLETRNETLAAANKASLDYCFPSRLEELILLLKSAQQVPQQPQPFYLLGNWFYDRRRHEDAITAWQKSLSLDPSNAIAWRNLGIAMFNVRGDAVRASECFDRAFETKPDDARLLYERDQLWKRIGIGPAERLQSLHSHRDLVYQRDDLSIELATLYNQLGRPEDALQILAERLFQPWEGGEGLALGQYVRAHMLCGQAALDGGEPATALRHLKAALLPPPNLSEAKHLLANQSDIYFWLGRAHDALGQNDAAKESWQRASRQKGDFQQMSVRSVSDMSYWTGMALAALGRENDAAEVFHEVLRYADDLETKQPKIDYFATSLPAMLLFEEDLVRRNAIEAKFLRAQALTGLMQHAESVAMAQQVLSLDKNHADAADLLRQLTSAAVETR